MMMSYDSAEDMSRSILSYAASLSLPSSLSNFSYEMERTNSQMCICLSSNGNLPFTNSVRSISPSLSPKHRSAKSAGSSSASRKCALPVPPCRRFSNSATIWSRRGRNWGGHFSLCSNQQSSIGWFVSLRSLQILFVQLRFCTPRDVPAPGVPVVPAVVSRGRDEGRGSPLPAGRCLGGPNRLRCSAGRAEGIRWTGFLPSCRRGIGGRDGRRFCILRGLLRLITMPFDARNSPKVCSALMTVSGIWFSCWNL